MFALLLVMLHPFRFLPRYSTADAELTDIDDLMPGENSYYYHDSAPRRRAKRHSYPTIPEAPYHSTSRRRSHGSHHAVYAVDPLATGKGKKSRVKDHEVWGHRLNFHLKITPYTISIMVWKGYHKCWSAVNSQATVDPTSDPPGDINLIGDRGHLWH